ncbi:unnamed protein product [Orchesella dallaii]|uniref:C2H2-type domain-containing protein n=1 Tax=Orchesella dallaii TaxID=48710 RepID=A0ABP1RBC9_9HEXA
MLPHRSFGSRGKIPGPASKTLFKTPRPSSQASLASITSTAGEGGRGMETKSRSLTFASAITDCWNTNGSSTSNITNFPGSSSSSTSNRNQERITCIFCCNLVLSSTTSTSGGERSDEKRSRMLKNLCFHMQISSKDIPEKCSRKNFPFCKVCEEFVKQMWDFQGALDKIRLKMSKIVTTIERTVVDGEILNPKNDKGASSHQKRLREMILQGYRNKLLVKQQMRDSLVLGNSLSDYNPMVNLKLERNEDESVGYDGRSFNSSLCPSPSSTGSFEETPGLKIIGDNEIIQELNVNEEIEIPEESPAPVRLEEETNLVNNSMEIVPRYEESHDEPFSYDEEHDDDDDDDELEMETGNNQESYWATERGREAVAQYNENNCTLVISNIHGSDGASFTAEVPSLVQVKKEIHENEHSTQNEEEEDVDIDVVGDENGPEQRQLLLAQSDDDIFMVEPRKRRLLFEGVEIYKVTGSLPGVEYLQCSLCSHTLKIPKRAAKGDVTTYTKLKIHIQTSHQLVIPTRVQAPSRRKPENGVSEEDLENRETLREHRRSRSRSSSEENIMECDICGRPIKGGSEFNLLLHKFSHKNDAERKAAIAANERGTYSALLSKRFKAKRGKRGRTKKRQPTRRISNVKESGGNGKEIVCNFCNRTFPRKCYLTLHMRIHSSDKRWPGVNAHESDEEETETTSQENVVDPGPPVLQPQHVPVITYPPAPKKSNKIIPGSSSSQSNRLMEFCNAIGISRVEKSQAFEEVERRQTHFDGGIREDEVRGGAPILKREVVS